jgi:hypothetical protein
MGGLGVETLVPHDLRTGFRLHGRSVNARRFLIHCLHPTLMYNYIRIQHRNRIAQ